MVVEFPQPDVRECRSSFEQFFCFELVCLGFAEDGEGDVPGLAEIIHPDDGGDPSSLVLRRDVIQICQFLGDGHYPGDEQFLDGIAIRFDVCGERLTRDFYAHFRKEKSSELVSSDH